jgi:hypothetical protein
MFWFQILTIAKQGQIRFGPWLLIFFFEALGLPQQVVKDRRTGTIHLGQAHRRSKNVYAAIG